MGCLWFREPGSSPALVRVVGGHRPGERLHRTLRCAVDGPLGQAGGRRDGSDVDDGAPVGSTQVRQCGP